MMMKMMMARLTSCLSPFLGFSLSLSCSLRCLSRWRWWRTIRLQDGFRGDHDDLDYVDDHDHDDLDYVDDYDHDVGVSSHCLHKVKK